MILKNFRKKRTRLASTQYYKIDSKTLFHKISFTCFIWTRLFLSCSAILVHFYFAKKYIGFPYFRWIKLIGKPILATGVMLFVLTIISSRFENNFINLISLSLIGCVIYLTTLLMIDTNFVFKEILPILKNH